jgi:hypothetical protein
MLIWTGAESRGMGRRAGQKWPRCLLRAAYSGPFKPCEGMDQGSEMAKIGISVR